MGDIFPGLVDGLVDSGLVRKGLQHNFKPLDYIECPHIIILDILFVALNRVSILELDVV